MVNRRLRYFLALIIIGVFLTFSANTQSIIYVNHVATGSDNGSCWIDAFIRLQDALQAAQSGDEVWVAAGTYKPDQGTGITPGDREASFFIPGGVSVYGGFVGTELTSEERDWGVNRTVLSGDLLGNDTILQSADARSEYGYPAFSLEMASSRGGLISVVWTDYRHALNSVESENDYGGIVYAQLLTRDLEPVSSNIRITDLEQGITTRGPSVSMDSKGNFVIAWLRRDATGLYSVWARRFRSNGQPHGNEFRVDDDPSGAPKTLIEALLREDGSLVCVWSDWRDGYISPYAQFFLEDGLPLGTNVRINSNDHDGSIQVGELENGRFFILTNGKYFYEYASDFSQIVPPQTLPQSSTTYPVRDNELLLVWRSEDFRRIFTGVYKMTDPNMQMSYVRVDDDTSNQIKADVAVAWDPDTREIIFVWVDHRTVSSAATGPGNIYAQRMKIDDAGLLDFLGENYKISDQGNNDNQMHPVVLLEEGTTFAAWLETLPCSASATLGIAFDPIASLRLNRQSYSAPLDSARLEYTLLSSGACIVHEEKDAVVSVFPNPHQTKFTIVVHIADASIGRILLYDVIGREVMRYESTQDDPGIHTMVVDTSDLPDGVYLYTVTLGDRSISGAIVKSR